MRLRESATRSRGDGIADGHVALRRSGHVPKARQTGKARGKRDLDDGAVEELLFGWFEGWNREGEKTKISSVNSILSFPFFLFSDQLSLSRDIINPIVFDQINYLPGFHTRLLCATVNDSLRTRIMC